MPFDLSSHPGRQSGYWEAPEERLPSQTRPPSSQEIYRSRELQLSDGTAVFLRHWSPGSPRGRVLLLHGKGDHGGGFGPLAEELVARGWEVLAPDMRGFGRSDGIRCWIDHFGQYRADLEAIVEQVWPQPGILQVWCGYSAGANWATEYALAHPDQVQGLILISPAFRIDHYFNRFTWGLLQVLDKVLPQLALTGLYEPVRVTSLPEQQAVLAADPYVCGVTRARFTAELVRSGQRCLEQAHRLELPVLVLYTSADIVVNPAGAVEFARRLPQGEIYDFSCSRHDLLHDCQAEAVQETLCQWLDRHFPCRLGPRGKIERPSFCLLP
jgi:alpha-beta hydrolase superfamily lysophospholipase